MSIYIALCFSRDVGFAHILVASDNITVIKACNGLLQFTNYSGAIVEDILKLVPYCNSIYFVHELRQANVVAHQLAKWGACFLSPVILMEDMPSAVLRCIVKDLSS